MRGRISKFKWDREELNLLYHSRDMTCKEIGALKCCCDEMVRRALVKLGIPRKPGINRPGRKYPNKRHLGDKNPAWKGGITRDKQGYILILVPDHPFADHKGRVRQHRLVMEKKLGRFLTKKEVVHHTGAVDDNDPERLFLFASNGEHLAATLKGKCPKWTADGYRRIKDAVQKQKRVSDNRVLIEKYAEIHGVDAAAISSRLTKFKKRRLCDALRAGNFGAHPVVTELEKTEYLKIA